MQIQFERRWVIPAIVGVTSFGVGTVVGYIRCRRQYVGFLKVKLEEVDELKSEQLQLDFKRVEMDREFNQMIQQANHTIRKFNERGQDFLERFGADKEVVMQHPSYREEDDDEMTVSVDIQEDGSKVVSIFLNEDDPWDYDEEVKHRTPENPYIIHVDEYQANEENYTQSTLTFYKMDEVLTDELDTPVYDPENIVGELIFGHGSKDPSICYIRNDRLMAEYEVLLDHGSFQAEVLGVQLEEELTNDIKHSLHKFYKDD